MRTQSLRTEVAVVLVLKAEAVDGLTTTLREDEEEVGVDAVVVVDVVLAEVVLAWEVVVVVPVSVSVLVLVVV